MAPSLGELDLVHAITDSTNAELMAGYVVSSEGPLMRYDAAGEKIYYLTDAVGTVIGWVDESGALVAEFQYSSFGEMLGDPSSLPTWGDYRYHGHWLDASTDLYHARARYCDPATGRFLSRDPAGVDVDRPETFNEYAFALSNPWIYRDPRGAFTVTGLTVGMGVSDLLGAIRTAAVQHVKNRAKDELGQAGGSLRGT